MNVTDLLLNFRLAIKGVVPFVERAGVAWRRPDAYDEWDNIATALYEALIVEPLRFGLPESEQQHFSIPAYDLLLPSYLDESIIEVLFGEIGESIKVFHAFGTAYEPFDMVEWRSVNRGGLPESDHIECTPIEGARFAFRLNEGNFPGRQMEDILLSIK